MKKFYERFCNSESILRQAVAVLPWGHTLTLMRKFADDDAIVLSASFYVPRKTVWKLSWRWKIWANPLE